MSFLLDTNVVSELRQPRPRPPNPNVLRWATGLQKTSTYISVITVMEVEKGILQLERRSPAQAQVLREWLTTQVLPAFAGRILPVDIVVAQRAAALHIPTRRSDLDALIAATALAHNLTVATRNTAHFAPMGVPTLDPWLS